MKSLTFSVRVLVATLGLLLVLMPFSSAQTTRGAHTSVIGGFEVPSGPYRSVGALRLPDPKRKPSNYGIDSLYSFCSATLIAPKVILTAAHCLRGEKSYLHPTVIFNKKSLIDRGPGKRLRVANIAIYPNYSPKRR